MEPIKSLIFNFVSSPVFNQPKNNFGLLILTSLLCALFILNKDLIGWTKRRFWRYYHLEKLSGPVAYPVIGNVQNMIFSDFVKWTTSLCERFGSPLRLWRFSTPMVFVSDYAHAVELLSKSSLSGKMQDLNMIRQQPGGKGLSTAPAEIHPHRRKLLNPAFSRQVVEHSIEIFRNESKKLVSTLERFAASGESCNIVDQAMTCLFFMVARSDFGDAFMDSGNEFEALQHMHALHTIAKNISKRILTPYLWQRNDFIYYNFTKDGTDLITARDTLNDFAARAIERRRHQRSKNSKDPGVVQDSQRCYLDVLLDLAEKGEMTEDDVISELNNFMGGAYDTTALAVCWTLFLLALNPEHQLNVQEELDEIFGTSQTSSYNMSVADTKQMKYLELCLKESMRLYTPAPTFPRSSVRDIKLEDGRVIPAGVDVLILANLIHRDPKYFPNPEEFRPERHLEAIPAYIPFSLGARNCIGQTYAMYQSKVVLGYLLREYFWETRDDMRSMETVYRGLLYPKNGIKLNIKKRRYLET